MGAARALHGMGKVEWRLEHVQQAAARLQEALALLQDAQVPDTVNVLTDLATLNSVSLSRQQDAVEQPMRALQLAEQ